MVTCEHEAALAITSALSFFSSYIRESLHTGWCCELIGRLCVSPPKEMSWFILSDLQNCSRENSICSLFLYRMWYLEIKGKHAIHEWGCMAISAARVSRSPHSRHQTSKGNPQSKKSWRDIYELHLWMIAEPLIIKKLADFVQCNLIVVPQTIFVRWFDFSSSPTVWTSIEFSAKSSFLLLFLCHIFDHINMITKYTSIVLSTLLRSLFWAVLS